MSDSFKNRLREYIQDEDFFKELLEDINSEANGPAVRFKLKMELLSYIEPKLKTQDAAKSDQGTKIEITFTDAVNPTEGEDDGNSASPLPEEVS